MSGRTVILGGTGFVGGALAAELGRRGADVHAVGSSTVDLTAREADARLAGLLGPDTTLVVAARTRNAPDGPARFLADTAIVAAAAGAVNLAPPARCVYFSSFAVYGEDVDRLEITEETAPNPSSYYGAARFAGELLLGVSARRESVPLLVVRPSSVYGPGDETGAYGPARFIRELLERGEVRLFGDGRELRDYVFVDDVARAVADLVERGATGTYNAASGRSASFVELAGLLAQVADRPFEVVEVPRLGPPRGSQSATPAKLLAESPGFRFTPLEDGLTATYVATAS